MGFPPMRHAPSHVMAKPTGALCNLGCRCCYYLEKERLYPAGEAFRMPGAVLEAFVRQHIAAQPGPEVAFTWQGASPSSWGWTSSARSCGAWSPCESTGRPSTPLRW